MQDKLNGITKQMVERMVRELSGISADLTNDYSPSLTLDKLNATIDSLRPVIRVILSRWCPKVDEKTGTEVCYHVKGTGWTQECYIMCPDVFDVFYERVLQEIPLARIEIVKPNKND